MRESEEFEDTYLEIRNLTVDSFEDGEITVEVEEDKYGIYRYYREHLSMEEIVQLRDFLNTHIKKYK